MSNAHATLPEPPAAARAIIGTTVIMKMAGVIITGPIEWTGIGLVVRPLEAVSTDSDGIAADIAGIADGVLYDPDAVL